MLSGSKRLVLLASSNRKVISDFEWYVTNHRKWWKKKLWDFILLGIGNWCLHQVRKRNINRTKYQLQRTITLFRSAVLLWRVLLAIFPFKLELTLFCCEVKFARCCKVYWLIGYWVPVLCCLLSKWWTTVKPASVNYQLSGRYSSVNARLLTFKRGKKKKKLFLNYMGECSWEHIPEKDFP